MKVKCLFVYTFTKHFTHGDLIYHHHANIPTIWYNICVCLYNDNVYVSGTQVASDLCSSGDLGPWILKGNHVASIAIW